jgi:hypothetical protein
MANLPLRRAATNVDMKMNAQVTKLQAAENDLKELMADMTRAIKKAEEAIGKIAPQMLLATAETESTASSR